MKTPIYCLPPLFSNFVHPPPPSPSLQLHFPVTSNPYPHCSFCFPVSLADWVITLHLKCHLNDNLDLWIYVEPWYLNTRRILMCVLCNKASNLSRSDTWCGFLLVLLMVLLSYTQTQTHIAHSGASRLTHPYKYKYHLLCAQGSYLYHIK